MIAPPGSKLGIDMENNVIMVMEYRIGTDIDSKDICQPLHAIDDPLASMSIAFTGKRVASIPQRKAWRTQRDTQW
jgi:hypothetical protein